MSGNLTWLAPDNLEFPDIGDAWEEPNGLLAGGGDLKPARLVEAYRKGIFPWYEDGQPILWWSPHPRMLLFPAEIHISRSLRKVMKKGAFTLSMDRAFTQVITECAKPRRDQGGTWITRDMQAAYGQLHHRGIAHSLEVWQDRELVGGIYGVAVAQAFFGESMFSRVTDASKVALVALARQLQAWNFGFIDCQMETTHLRSMGARAVPRAEFKQLLLNYTEGPMKNEPWQLSWQLHD